MKNIIFLLGILGLFALASCSSKVDCECTMDMNLPYVGHQSYTTVAEDVDADDCENANASMQSAEMQQAIQQIQSIGGNYDFSCHEK
ncbi:MAG: hypothetical protein LBR28_06620 [Bacteroidales bacterium]|jgi:hypothetical protein|nr:hypothetical protein [Bacteroidales bacterium]